MFSNAGGKLNIVAQIVAYTQMVACIVYGCIFIFGKERQYGKLHILVGIIIIVFGVLISLLLLIPINSIIHSLTNNSRITAFLPFGAGIVLIVLSTVLTLIGGLIPSRKASKQDPVLALRSE